jgi:tetratricopeptide (TPR) repeat protein
MSYSPQFLGCGFLSRLQCLLGQSLQLWDEALVELTRAIGGELPFIYKRRAQVFSHLGKNDAALQDYSQALTIFEGPMEEFCPERAQIFLERARVQERLCKYDLAFKDLVSARSSDQGNREVYFEFFILARNFIMANWQALCFAFESLILLTSHGLFRRRKIKRLL